MYAYITTQNVVGQLFTDMPPNGQYHPDFVARIRSIPEDVWSGWVYDTETDPYAEPEEGVE